MATAAELTGTTGTDTRIKPELLAPAGDQTCLVAAIENGADAVYFGVQGHNARARATNFDVESLSDVMDLLHRRGVKGYVTLNTLVFPKEINEVAGHVARIAEAGVDAVIVQDLGLARLIRGICPDLEIHASTQMSITSAEGMRLAEELGCKRVILARELSLDEIRRVRQGSSIPVEVFVHGALCVAYSGQCLTSEALGGRSANRGECAQACRMPYEIVCDGETVDLDQTKYLLSPQDLAAFDLVPKLMEIGVASLKIEGRLKTPEYVANITQHYRRAVDEAWAGRALVFSKREVEEMELSFSRGFSHGFLDGNDHKVLVRGDYAKKRGVFLGDVTAVGGQSVRINLAAPLKRGDGVVFDGNEEASVPEQGGRVFDVAPVIKGRAVVGHAAEVASGPVELAFGRHDIDIKRLHVGQRLWKTDDPELTKRLRKTFEGAPRRRVLVNVRLEAAVDAPLRLSAETATGLRATAVSDASLVKAERHIATVDQLREQVDRFGDTCFELGECEIRIEGAPLVPKSLVNQLRRSLVEQLNTAEIHPRRSISEVGAVLESLRPERMAVAETTQGVALSVLCRTTEQVEAAIAGGVSTIYAEYQDIKRYREAVAATRGAARLYLATPRIQKPGEANLFRYLEKQGAEGILVRNPGGLYFCADSGIPFVADFSLNASNELTVAYLLSRGAERVTASYDLAFQQLEDLLANSPVDRMEVVLHQQIPMFHMEFCAFSAHLSNGQPHPECGRPCDDHDVKLRDRTGVLHPLKADVGCRNTLFNAVPQTAAEFLPRLLARGARHLRLEFLDDSPASVTRILGLYRNVIEGKRDGRSLWKDLKATNQYGVTRGSLVVIH